MFRFIKSNVSIFSMATPRKQAIELIEAKQESIITHIIKCVLYGNQFNCYDHWIKEISSRLKEISEIELDIKRRPKKLKIEEYNNLIWGHLGTTVSDANNAIYWAFHTNSWNKRDQKYPEIEITYNAAELLTEAAQYLREVISPMLAESRIYGNAIFQVKLHQILDPLCLN